MSASSIVITGASSIKGRCVNLIKGARMAYNYNKRTNVNLYRLKICMQIRKHGQLVVHIINRGGRHKLALQWLWNEDQQSPWCYIIWRFFSLSKFTHRPFIDDAPFMTSDYILVILLSSGLYRPTMFPLWGQYTDHAPFIRITNRPILIKDCNHDKGSLDLQLPMQSVPITTKLRVRIPFTARYTRYNIIW
jgi:hypothetical protein